MPSGSYHRGVSRRLPYLTAKLQGFGTTIFAEMSALATETGAVNLGQGFPDYDGPRVVLDAAKAGIDGGLNQYPPGPGMAVLREAIAEHQLRFWGLDYDPVDEVLVTAGATEALAGALLGLLDTGDEVVVFEPMYDSYQAAIALAGATARPVTLRPRRRHLPLRCGRAAGRDHAQDEGRCCSTRRTTRRGRSSTRMSCRSSPTSWWPTT